MDQFIKFQDKQHNIHQYILPVSHNDYIQLLPKKPDSLGLGSYTIGYY